LCSRARIVLSSAEGEPNHSIAQRLRLTKATVGKWRTRFIEQRIAGLDDNTRPGAPRTMDDERVAQWSVRWVAAQTGISKTSLQRYFPWFGLQPHRSEGFKLSNDPFFVHCATWSACT
jgi:putative transposase